MAVRTSRADLLRTWWRERIGRTLPLGDALVRRAEPEPRLTDSLDVGDFESERAHRYRSPDATAPYEVTSRYELGPDHLPASIAHPLAVPDHHVDYRLTRRAGAITCGSNCGPAMDCSMRRVARGQ